MINGCFRGCGGIIGLAYGWVLDRKLIHYNEARGTWQTKLYRYLLGMIGLTLLFKTFPSLISFLSALQKLHSSTVLLYLFILLQSIRF